MYKRYEFITNLNEKTQAKRDWYRTYARNCFDFETSVDKKGRVIRKLKFDARYYPIIKEAVKNGYLSPEEIELIKLRLRVMG